MYAEEIAPILWIFSKVKKKKNNKLRHWQAEETLFNVDHRPHFYLGTLLCTEYVRHELCRFQDWSGSRPELLTSPHMDTYTSPPGTQNWAWLPCGDC